MDQASADLIQKLLQQDAEEALDSYKSQPGATMDVSLAIGEWRKEIQLQEALSADLKKALSMQRAAQDDGVAISLVSLEEERAAADRATAMRVGGVKEPAGQASPQASAQSLHNLRSALDHLQYDPTYSQPVPHGDLFLGEDGSADNQKATQLKCASCLERHETKHMLHAACSHTYCRKCMADLCEMALTTEAFFPPRCCLMDIPLSTLRPVLNADLLQRFEEKLIERKDTCRTYCSNSVCSKYLLPECIKDYVGQCTECAQVTCTICKKEAHPNACVDEPNEVLQLAQTEGWQQCSQCGHVVELNTGCYHITCHCRHKFCYLCGARWKTCQCAQWDERRLLDRAHQIAARNPQGSGAENVQQIADRLRNDHACNHHRRWQRIEGQYECDECGDVMEEFILQCPICQLQTCASCKRYILGL
ncbi:hypothetical protein N7492_007949 [Penicillium capsulatum]|uniref:RING-type domain-containing protein n=1 Tax=Penicillium capsulatum TaxID=69766 RepID=A0A9W9HPW6_9EURO|nr:hypothetical protein N7492_007949 [Penicillium capsulatum]KAJ6105356.1 hypothetical protein N7512_008873 [Penicillium capsulatum]